MINDSARLSEKENEYGKRMLIRQVNDVLKLVYVYTFG